MGMGIYSNLSNVKVYELKNPDGSVAGTIRITKPAKKKKKRLQYKFKYISDQILMSKTSSSVGKAAIRARMTVGILQKKLKTGDFDEKEVELAIIHAKKMERIARKRMKHLQEEENAKRHGLCQDEADEKEICEREDQKEEKIPEMREEELRKQMEELQKLMEETMKKTADETGLSKLADTITGNVYKDMDKNELEILKKKRRAAEFQEIIEADMRYLKALFYKLQKEKEEASRENCTGGSNEGVSLELSGTEMPVQTSEALVMAEGESIDLSV